MWFLGILLAAVSLQPVTSHWNFYGQTGICVPLPITRRDFPGQKYSFCVIIVFNFILFLKIGSGQGLIYKSIIASRMKLSDRSIASQDLAIARRLLAVVVSDFLCWFPIGLLGLLASNGAPVPGEGKRGRSHLRAACQLSAEPFPLQPQYSAGEETEAEGG